MLSWWTIFSAPKIWAKKPIIFFSRISHVQKFIPKRNIETSFKRKKKTKNHISRLSFRPRWISRRSLSGYRRSIRSPQNSTVSFQSQPFALISRDLLVSVLYAFVLLHKFVSEYLRYSLYILRVYLKIGQSHILLIVCNCSLNPKMR